MVLRGKNRSTPTPIGAASGDSGRRGVGNRGFGNGRGGGFNSSQRGGSSNRGTNNRSHSDEAGLAPHGVHGAAVAEDDASTAAWPQPVAQVTASAPPQGQPWPQEADLEYQKQVAHQLLDALDEDSLWDLARILQSRGLIKSVLPEGSGTPSSTRSISYAGSTGVPTPSGAKGTTGANTAYTPLEAGMAGAIAAAGMQAANVPFFSVAHAAASSHTTAILANNMHGLQETSCTAMAPVELRTSVPLQANNQQSQLHNALPSKHISCESQPIVSDASVADLTSSKGDYRNVITGLCGDAGDCSSLKADEGASTTLILRNLPPCFDQQTAQKWVDEKGYRDLYDFLLWFPAKKTSRLNTSSYAFVNFRSIRDAQRFRQEFHLARFPVTESEAGSKQQWPLSIAVAKVQGFVENYVRFHHLLDDKSPTLCQPYFARDSVDQLSPETREKAAVAASHAPHLDNMQEGPCTTLIIRNLPQSVDSQDVARHWLDRAGFAGHYDFFLWLPAKRKRLEPSSGQPGPPQGLGYAFVNLRAPELAFKCADTLNGKNLSEGDPILNVVAARVQGLEECLSHFSSLGDNGRVMPWTDCKNRPPRQYQ